MAYVLLADDDRSFCDIIHRVLVAAGHEVLDAGDGRTCEDMVERREPDLVILDILMPEKEGIEVIADLRSRHPKMKILAISGGGRAATGEEFLILAKRFGADAILAKPFANSELLSAVRSVLSH
jgi:DNA-binding response OmpR family regulator